MKKNKIIKIVAAFVVFLLLVVIYLLLKDHNEEAEKQTDEAAQNVIINIPDDEIKSLTFTVEKEEKEFVKDQDAWTLKQDADFPVNAEQMKVLTDALSGVNASRTLEMVENLDDYGLLEPSNEIIAAKTSGDSVAITIGDTNAVTGDCYVYLNNDVEKIYTVDSDLATVFAGSLLNYAVETPYPTIIGSNINDIQIESGEFSYHLQSSDNSSTGWNIIGNGETKEADSDTIASLQSTIAGLTFAGYYDYNCDDLSKYGLDVPYATIIAGYTEQSQETSEDGVEGSESTESTEETTQEEKQVKIIVGNEDGNGNRYVQVNDSKEVHAIAADSINNLLNKEESSYESNDTGTINTKDVESLDVMMNDETHKFLIESSDEEGKETKYFLDEQVIDASQYADFYAKISGLGTQGELTEHKEIVGNPDVTIVYYLKDGSVKEISYIVYDNNFYVAVTPENETQYLVNKMKVKELMESAQTLFPEVFKVSG